jgi:hypothetical protein
MACNCYIAIDCEINAADFISKFRAFAHQDQRKAGRRSLHLEWGPTPGVARTQ